MYVFCADSKNKNSVKRNQPDNIFGELVAAGWPSWLAADAGEALKGWLPRRVDTFKNLGKASIAKDFHLLIAFIKALLH